ncbi:MAG: hypothetical protein MUC97_07190 [Bernardetiaceae bacterium]|nr:hypothetical protein [Bernardetiaceae bacterium]
MTLQIDVWYDLVEKLGQEALRQKVQQYLEWEKLRLAAQEIQESAQANGTDLSETWRQARSLAWDEYKKQHLPFLPTS